MQHNVRTHGWAMVVLVCGVLYGCQGESAFDSADPSGGPDARDGANEGTGGSSAAGGSGPSTDGNEDGERIIEEADIINVTGTALYALSQYGGLSVLDISAPDDLRVLGRHKVVAQPFEMYVRDGIVFGLYQGYGEYVEDEAAQETLWTTTSRIVIVDAREPASMTELSTFDVPGNISDSRLVGDVLYVVGFENGGCWGCQEGTPRTTVISLDVSDPEHVALVDDLAFDDDVEDGGWKRSVTVNQDRMYVAGPRWGSAEPEGSIIQVVDISSADGSLRLGAEVPVSGQINSRWQMDEYDGVLRVLSQPFEWDLSVPPRVETFAVESFDEVTPLGATSLELPRPEQLQSVRFDGPRGYAITFQRTDPLFTIDLSDPAAPAQVGSLEMPGFVYHMEPRGDRLLGLGFDQGNPEGALHVSLFDVTDLSTPTLIDRANFGGDWASVAEDQDRIHKAFRVLDEEGLILMPFSGFLGGAVGPDECQGRYTSGIQLIDWSDDELTARGVAETRGQARRGFLGDGVLFSVSDERVQTFDIADRAEPRQLDEAKLSRFVSKTVAVGDDVVTIGHDWWSNVSELAVVGLGDVTDPNAGAGVSVEYGDADSCSPSWLDDVFEGEQDLYLLTNRYEYDVVDGKESRSVEVVVVDVGDPREPNVVGSVELDAAPNDVFYDGNLAPSGRGALRVGSALVLAQATVEYTGDRAHVTANGLSLVDLSEPTEPEIASISLPTGLGVTGLVASEGIVARGRYVESPLDSSDVRFFVDRVDVSDPVQPRRLPSVNVPGSLLAYDAETERVVTVDYRREVRGSITAQECYEEYVLASFEGPSNYDYDSTPGTCTAVLQTLRLVQLSGEGADVLGSESLGPRERVGAVAFGDDRLFVKLDEGYYGGALVDCFDCGYYYGIEERPVTLVVLGGLASGDFAVGRIELQTGDYWGTGPLAASGTRAILASGWRGKLSVVDAADPEEPTLLREVSLSGSVQHLSTTGDVAIASMGYDGVQTVSLADE